MAKVIALYKKPQNPQEFDERYFNGHLPLAQKIPGLVRCDVSKVKGTPMGESEWYLMAELHFESMDALKAGMSSAEGKAAGKDVMAFAGDLVYIMFVDEQKVPAPAGK
jgi:uncharacterized protein (TIGR02118 family)